jgi:isopenicillin-N N-acyltransferase-like protein
VTSSAESAESLALNAATTDRLTAEPPRLVLARGDALERGQQIGESTADLIGSALDVYESRFASETQLSKNDLVETAREFSEAIEGYSPQIHATLAGIAEGAEIALEKIVLLNSRTEILYRSGQPSERHGACTTGAVRGDRSATGHTYVLQNWDWRDNLSAQTFLLGTEDEEGHRTLTLAEAGMLAKSGVSSSGIGLGVNLLASDRGGDRGGVPFHIIARSVLEARTPSDALRAALDVRRAAAGNLVIGFSGGEAVDVELVPGDFAVEHPRDGILTHANHFSGPRKWADIFGPRSALTFIRDERLRRLLDEAGSTIAPADMVAALRDHFSYPDGICRHVDPNVPRDEQVATLYSLVIDTDQRSLWIAGQNACTTPYHHYRLADLFTDEAPEQDFLPEENYVTHSNHS